MSAQPRRLDRRRFVAMLLAASRARFEGARAQGQEADFATGIEARIDRLAHDSPLEMLYLGSTAEECRRWQRLFSSQLKKLLGPIDSPAAWKVRSETVVDQADHQRHELVVSAEGTEPLPMHLLVPKGFRGVRPGVLALHGHGQFGHEPVSGVDDRPELRRAIQGANYDYGRQLVSQGYVVAVPCLTPFGRRRGGSGDNDICGVTAIRMLFLGRLLIGENLRDARWAISVMLDRAEVDPERLACVGLSYGGRMTTLLAALDDRIRVAVVSGALNCFQERVSTAYAAGCQMIPGLLQYGDVPEIASLIAPRHLLFEVGSQDKLVPSEWVETAWLRMQRAYRSLDAQDHLRIDRFEGGHRWNGSEAYPLLASILSP